MHDLHFFETGCEPTRGPGAVMVLARRVLRGTLRPMFLRLVAILAGVIERLDRADHRHDDSERRHDGAETRHDDAETRLDRAESRLERAEKWHDEAERRHDGAETRHDDAETRLDRAESRLERAEKRHDEAERRLGQDDARLDQVELRLDAAEWRCRAVETRAAVDRAEAARDCGLLFRKADGLASHLEGVTAEHRALEDRVRKRGVQSDALSETTGGLGRRQDELGEKIEAIKALHWDHVALARRLAVIEDLLAISWASGGAGPRPSIPFPGLDDGVRSRLS